MNRLTLSIAGVAAAIAIVIVYMSFYTIYPTEQAILCNGAVRAPWRPSPACT